MPHNAEDYVITNVAPNGVSAPLNHADAAYIERILREDAKDYLYSGLISLANAFASIRLRFYSWSTVKLYYATFYMIRGLLANAGICVCYLGTKPIVLKAAAGEQMRYPRGGRKAATTHGIVLETAKRELPNDVIFSQPIAGMHAVDWMRERREEANYWHSRFVEPGIPDHMRMVNRTGLRRLITAYMGDLLSYSFDPDHAIIAYPMLVCERLRQHISTAPGAPTQPVDEDDQNYLRSLFVDNAGVLSVMNALLRDIE